MLAARTDEATHMPFTNKTAIVTGAGGGMGLNIARDLLAGGARVTMIDSSGSGRPICRSIARSI